MTTALLSETTVANEELAQLLDTGEPWPAETCDRLGQLWPAVLRDLFHALKLRTVLRRPFAEAVNLDPATELDLNKHLRQRFCRYRSRPQEMVSRLTMLLKWQFHHVVQNASEKTRRMLWHVYQVQVQPSILRQRMRRLLGLTFLPGRRLSSFAPGEQFVPLNSPRVLTLAVRPHRLRSGKIIDALDLKLHALHLDVESGVAMVGGPTTLMAKHFNFATSRQPDRLTQSVDNVAVVEGALALHEAMEQAAIDGVGAQAAPAFPDIYLGFRARDEIAIEYSDSLQRRVLRHADAWLRRGRPNSWPQLPGLVDLNGSLRRPPSSWTDMTAYVGESTSKFLLEQAWDQSIVEHEGLFLVPADNFEPYSPQRPVRCAARAFAHFPPHLMGRDTIVADGERVMDDTLARAQVILRHGNCAGSRRVEQAIAGLQGSVEGVDFDFTSAPRGLEPFFAPAASESAPSEA